MSVTSDMLEIIPSANAVSVNSTPLSKILLLLLDLRPGALAVLRVAALRYLRYLRRSARLTRPSPHRQTLMARHRAWTVQISRSSTTVIRS
jgi:hypothetical protein